MAVLKPKIKPMISRVRGGEKANEKFFSHGSFFQPKLSVGPVNDVYEKEADAVAEKVNTPLNNNSNLFSLSGHKIPARTMVVQPKCAHCEEEERLQRKEKDDLSETETPDIVNDSMGSSGTSLDNRTCSFMENSFGYDFSNVRVHTDTAAAKSAQSINALAYTSGSDIFFNEGKYSPGTPSGRKTLAHELTHVIQQNGNVALRKRIQRQHVRLNSGRFVGDTTNTPRNLKEDVLDVLDSLHALWSISNANYSSEYAAVTGATAMSAVPISSIPRTIASIHSNEQPFIRHVVAQAQFGINLTASVGTGGTNNRADIYRLQDYLHTHWFLSNTNYSAERSAVNAGGDPVSTSSIPQTLAGLTRMKVSKVAEGYGRHDVLSGTRHISATERSAVEAALIPGATVSGTGTVTIPSPDPICATPAPLEAEIRTTIVPFIQGRASTFRTRRGSPPVLPLPQIRTMGDIVEEEMEGYFGTHLRGATSVTGARYQYGQYSVRSQIRDQSTTAQWRTEAGRRGWVNYWISTQIGNTHHCNQSNLDTVSTAIATDATLIPDIDDAINGWPAEATGGIHINPYLRDATASADEIRRARWDAFTIILHEALHHLAHPNYVNTYRQMRNDSQQILKEGVNDLFRRELWSGAGRLQSRIGVSSYNSKRAIIEGGSYPFNAGLVVYHADYPQIAEARRIQSAVGNANVKAAYFLGHTEYLGLGPGSPGVTGSLTGIASYDPTDPGRTGIVDTLPGETYTQLSTRINAGPGIIRNLSGSLLPTSGTLPPRIRAAGVRHVRAIAGDTIGSIAFQNGVSSHDIIRANRLTSGTISPGSLLLIPIH